MPWTTQSLEQVRSENRDNITARLRSGAMVPNSALRVLADANAGLAYLVLLYIDWLSKQLLPDTAEGEWLDRHANIWVGGRKAATYANGTADFTGTPGVIVPAGTILVGGNVSYQLTVNITLGSAAVPGPVTALDAGTVGNIDAGTVLTFQTPVDGVDSTAVVASMGGGTDVETDDELRARVLQRIRNPPMGGSEADYVRWAGEVPGVTRAWAAPEQGPGTITVRFLMDDLRAPDGWPNADDIQTVADHIDAVRPVTVKDCYVEAPVKQFISITVANLSPDTGETRAAITQSLQDMLMQKAAPGQTIYAVWISAAILGAPGVDSFNLVTDTDFVMPAPGYMGVLETVLFV
jgi:uncharacterized phage protein gp47/JayE